MSVGDENDIYGRLRGYLPRWFSDDAPIIKGLLHGLANGAAVVYALIQFARLQTRIKTATGGWLDLISADFFGDRLPRKRNQSDESYRSRIIVNLFRERGTRRAIVRVLEDLTGQTPIIFEPQRPADTGGYAVGGVGYGVAGGYGSLEHEYQAFVTAYRPVGGGIPYIAGYGISTGGYSQPSRAAYASLGQVEQTVTDADIYDAIDSVKVAGTAVWAQILPAPSGLGNTLDSNFILDQSGLG